MTVLQLPDGFRSSTPVARGARRVKLTVLVVWAALLLNVLTFYTIPTLLPIPGSVGQLVTQGALVLAFVAALLVNWRRAFRPSAYLVLLTLLALQALLVSLHSEFLLGSMYRAGRFAGFVLVLWLLSAWLGRRDMLLLRCHRICLGVVLGSVALGAVVAPGMAYGEEGRLAGIVWPVPPTQVGHYAAVMLGTTVLLWMCRVIPGRGASVTVALMTALLIASHTRTAILALAGGLVVGSAVILAGMQRARRTLLWGGALGLVVVSLFANSLLTWALRGQTDEDVAELTGRTKVWTALLAQDRSLAQEIFGSGMSNQSFDGLPIDNNWLATYQDLGLLGVLLQVLILVSLAGAALMRPAGPHKAVALFLVMYSILASVTESTFAGPTPYLLELFVAASLAARPHGPRETRAP